MSGDGRPSGRGVASLGCVVVDLAKSIDVYPEPNRLALIDQVALSTGGPALNMAVNLNRLGADYPLWIFGAVGDDEPGRFLRAECDRLGIKTSGLQITPKAATAFTDVFLEPGNGRRTMFHHPGASNVFEVSPGSVETSGARIVHLGSPGVLKRMDEAQPDGGNGWSALLARCRAAGLHTNMELVDLTAERARALVLPCLPHLDTLVINELEAGDLTGMSSPAPDADGPVDWAVLEAMAVRLVELGVSTLAVVHFPAGAVAAAPGGRTWRQGSVLLPPDRVRSAVGAGDAFGAGMLHGFHEGWDVTRSLRLAVAAAAACISDTHTSAGIKAAEACLADADALGYRPTG